MKKEITLGNLITILSSIIFPIVIWAFNVEKRFTEYNQRIAVLERTNTSIEYTLKEIKETQTKILIELQNKKNR